VRTSTIATLLVTLALGALASVPEAPAAEENPCAVPAMRTDERPGEAGPTTEVLVGIRMVDLTDVDDVSQTLTGDFAVFQRWTDPRLEGLVGCEVPIDSIWTPHLRFVNSGRLFKNLDEKADIRPGGTVVYVQRYYGTMASYHNLRRFPFDDQTFVVSLVSLEDGEDEVLLSLNERVTGRRDLLNISDWTVTAVEGRIRRQHIEATGKDASVYDLMISANRQRQFYIWKIIVPLCLIVFMSWTVFWVNPAQFGPQIGLSATSMLTLIAFQFATTSMVPKLGYFTTLDEFTTGSTIIVFLALVQSLTTSYLVSQDREALALRIDRLSRYVFPGVFALLILVVFFR
jgi:hypothetical protein